MDGDWSLRAPRLKLAFVVELVFDEVLRGRLLEQADLQKDGIQLTQPKLRSSFKDGAVTRVRRNGACRRWI
jgi:hypothetical protein